MLYQKLLTGETPYHLACTRHMNGSSFPEHRHPEAEFLYCRSGGMEVRIEKKTYTVKADQIVLIAPMEAHEVFYSEKGTSTVLLEVGPLLLRTKFNSFSGGKFSSTVKTLDGSTEGIAALKEILEETVGLKSNSADYSELLITGNVYKICGYVLSEFTEGSGESSMDMKSVENVEKALEMIQNRYAEPITVEMAAEETGYGKSNFCKIFKKITGETFHSALNRQRVENACVYLDETAMSITKISAAVGFAETKCFCRVFKSLTGMTPSERRKCKNIGE